jgi:hypothetical protein
LKAYYSHIEDVFQAHRFFAAMIQSPTHKLRSRRANRPLGGWLAFVAGTANAGDGFITTIPLAVVLSAEAAPPLWQDVGDGLRRRNGERSR